MFLSFTTYFRYANVCMRHILGHARYRLQGTAEMATVATIGNESMGKGLRAPQLGRRRFPNITVSATSLRSAAEMQRGRARSRAPVVKPTPLCSSLGSLVGSNPGTRQQSASSELCFESYTLKFWYGEW